MRTVVPVLLPDLLETTQAAYTMDQRLLAAAATATKMQMYQGWAALL